MIKGKALGVVRVPMTTILVRDNARIMCGEDDSRNSSCHFEMLTRPDEKQLDAFIDDSDVHLVLEQLGLSALQLEINNAEKRYPFFGDQAVWFTGSRSFLTEVHELNPHLNPTVELHSADLIDGSLSDGHALRVERHLEQQC